MFKEVAQLVHKRVKEIPKSTCIACFHHSVEYLFRYLTFEAL